jgi:glycine/D-amino acid oxidase-like deaminating enzyme/nitrite reductase/ring-hydroxylating ferredoxin subunit
MRLHRLEVMRPEKGRAARGAGPRAVKRRKTGAAPRRRPRTAASDPRPASVSLWMATETLPPRPPLSRSRTADVCVIGAGIAGLSAAYQLARAGRSVVVLDDGPIGGGQTGRTTAHLSHAMDVQYQAIRRLHGEQGARLAAESHTAAIDEIERIAREEDIACDFERVPGHLFVPRDESPTVLEREREAAHAAGLTRVELLPVTPELGAEAGPCLRFPDQAQFHPLRYLAGLAAAIERHGGHIFTQVHAEAVETEGATHRVTTGGRAGVTAGAVIAATNVPILGPQTLHAKQAAYLSYVIGARVPAGAVAHGLYWDTEDPYHYVRVQRPAPSAAHEILIVGGEDHKTGQADDAAKRYHALEEWARARFPTIEDVEFRWSGQVMNSLDGLAFIGRASEDEPDVYLATGDTGMGMTHGTIAGMLLRDLVLRRDNPWRALYDPSRLILRALPTLVRESVNVAAQYADWVTPAEVSSGEEIPPGQGALLRRGLAKIAAYRDTEGRLHERSAVCPHLACVVAWNSSEKTWDCPCHGSRFDALGRVINGPANTNLAAPEDER